MKIFFCLPGAFFFLTLYSGMAQSRPAVQWEFAAEDLGRHRVLLTITASLAPGWHIYSQFIGHGGPIPTRIVFTPSDSYTLTGATEETGQAVKTHDDLYDMDITWFEGKVTFHQNILLTRPDAIVRGRLDYMTCDDHTCVPSHQAFSISVPPSKKMP